MSKWRTGFKTYINNRLKNKFGHSIDINDEITQLVESIIKETLNNISYSKYVNYVERTASDGFDLMSKPFPEGCFEYYIRYKNNVNQNISIKSYQDMSNLPDILIIMIYNFVRHNRNGCKNGMNHYPNKWYIRPSECIKIHNGLKQLTVEYRQKMISSFGLEAFN